MGPEYIAGAAAITALIGAGAQFYSSMQQAEAAEEGERIAEKNAQRAELETEEQARRLKAQQEKNQSLARARAAASGAGGESIDTYLEDMEDEDYRQLDWLRRSGYNRSQIMRDEGRMYGRAGRARATAGMFSAGADIFGAAAKAPWWESDTAGKGGTAGKGDTAGAGG